MKKMGAVVSMLAWLTGCGTPTKESIPSASSSQEIVLSRTDGWTYASRYTYAPATHRLVGYWSHRGPAGRRTSDAERQLTDAEADDLEARLNGIQLDTTAPPGDCGADIPTLTLTYVEASGQSRTYYTDPTYNSCGEDRVFVRQKDVQAAFDICQALLPEPESTLGRAFAP